jgi:hypothetical protein
VQQKATKLILINLHEEKTAANNAYCEQPLLVSTNSHAARTDQGARQMYFSALILEKATVGKEPAHLFCEIVVIFEAKSIEDARIAAQKHGETQAHSYFNEEGQYVSWSLERVVDVQVVLDQPVKHASEVYSRFFRNFDDYVRFEPLMRPKDERGDA